MGWFSSPKPTAPVSISDEQLVGGGGGFHSSERAQRAPVQHNVTAGSSVPDANNNNGITPQVGGIPTQQYDYKNTLASTYFTQGDDRTRALIFSASNQFHRWLSYALGVAAYSFGSAMHVYGQGTALSTLTMTAAGTCFLNDSS
eukprot:GILI01031369.1.p1 GENE.GILI01031369.1~~GILI01031369.1.p1  ORF type:complete len:144 (-),score=25.53 GILI01031369.1:322-753(-)